MLAHLRAEVGSDAYRCWLRPLELQRVIEIDESHATVIAPWRALKHWAEAHFADRLLALWRAEDERLRHITIEAPPRKENGCAAAPADKEVWRRVLDRLRPEVGQDVLNWLLHLELQTVEPIREARLIAPTTFLRDWVDVHYADQLLALMQTKDRRISRIMVISPPLIMDDQHADDALSDHAPADASTRPSGMLRLVHDANAGPVIPEGLHRSVPTHHRQRNLGGRPPKYPWDELYCELIRIAQIDGFDDCRELFERANKWIATNWADQPSPSALREKLLRVAETLSLPLN